MRRAGRLFESVLDFGHLRASAKAAASGKRLSTGAASFLAELESEVLCLQRELTKGEYKPGPYRSFTVLDRKTRLISAAPFRDRVVHHAMCSVMEPFLERRAIFDSYACRKGKGSSAALARAQDFCRRNKWYLKLDVRHFFESLDHGVLRRELARVFKDRRLLDLVDRFIDAGAPGAPPGKGLPIGNLTSQHFANLYLEPADRFFKEKLGVGSYLRYLDDMLLFGDDRLALRSWRDLADEFLGLKLKVDLKPEATRLDRVQEGVPFLGYRIWPNWIRLDGGSVRRVRRRLHALNRGVESGRVTEDAAAQSGGSVVAWACVASGRGLARDMARASSIPWLAPDSFEWRRKP